MNENISLLDIDKSLNDLKKFKDKIIDSLLTPMAEVWLNQAETRNFFEYISLLRFQTLADMQKCDEEKKMWVLRGELNIINNIFERQNYLLMKFKKLENERKLNA